MDAEEFRKYGREMVDLVADYLENIRGRQVTSSVKPGYIWDMVPSEAPEDGEDFRNILSDVETVVMPGMTHWHSPRFHAYFPTANSYPGILGDILSGGLACIGFSWESSPACTELEMVVLDWLAKMMNLPRVFHFSSGGEGGGVIQGTASEATLVALLAARTKVIKHLREKQPSWSEAFIMGKLVCYTSAQSHSSVERAGMIGAVKMVLVKTNDAHQLTGDALREAIEADKAKGLVPFFVVAALGTTNTCAFDRLPEIGPICEKENIWLHIDAAYAGAAFICPEYQHYLEGIQYADSFNFNPHKWLLVNFDCSAMWVKNRYDLEGSFTVNPEYLKHEQQKVITDYRHWQIPLGRRFRSLKLWFVIRSYGVRKLQEHVRKQIAQANQFAILLKQDPRFELFCPVAMGLVCFKLKGSNEDNVEYLKCINGRRKIFMSPSKVGGVYFLRFAVCSRFTTYEDIEISWNEIQSVANEYLVNKAKTRIGDAKLNGSAITSGGASSTTTKINGH